MLPWRKVIDNVLLPLEIVEPHRSQFRSKKVEFRAKAEQLLATVGLAGFGDRYPWELSGGMQQRVSLCRSLIRDPQVMLMDEPFSALDALTRTELSEELQRIKMELSTTIVFVTHSIEEAIVLADRVVVLTPRPGRMREVVDVDIPRPRSLGQTAHVTEVATISARLHALLAEKEVRPVDEVPSR
jgi:NitT/TauT family transport system ATP-binding protein